MSKRKRRTPAGKGKRARRPRTTEQFFAQSVRAQETSNRVAHAISAMRRDGTSLRQASAENDVSPQTVLRRARAALRKGSSGRYKARPSDTLLRVLSLPTSDGLMELAIRDSRMATLIAEYLNAVLGFLQTGDGSGLVPFRGQYVIDASGRKVPFLTDLDELERLGSAGVLSFESLYARVG